MSALARRIRENTENVETNAAAKAAKVKSPAAPVAAKEVVKIDLVAIAAATPKVAHRPGRPSRFDAVPGMKDAVKLLAENNHSFKSAADVLKKQGVSFANQPSLRNYAQTHGIRFKTEKGPRKGKVAVATEPQPMDEGITPAVAHRPRGRRPAEIKNAINFLTAKGFLVQ